MKSYYIVFLFCLSKICLAQQIDTIQVLQQQLTYLDSISTEIATQTDNIHKRLEVLEKEQLAKNTSTRTPEDIDTAAVLFDKDTLFLLHYGDGMLSLQDRARIASDRIYQLSEIPEYSGDSLSVHEFKGQLNIMYQEMILVTIYERDAVLYGLSAKDFSNRSVKAIDTSLDRYFNDGEGQTLFYKIGKVVLVIICMLILIKLNNLIFAFLKRKTFAQKGKLLKGFNIKGLELINPGRQVTIIFFILNGIRLLLLLIILYLAIPIVFQIFTWTRGWADILFGYILNPLRSAGTSIVDFIPNLFTIIIIFLLTKYFIKFLGAIFSEIEKGKLKIDGFYPEWIKPTYNILRIVIYAFMFIIIFPYLPGSDSPVFQGVSVFFGLLLSLGSTSAISNLVAGLVITYMRPFQIGDRVQVGDIMGEVTEKNLLVTRLRTTKNEDVTVPNSNILNTKNMNYSTSSQSLGLILHTEVTIGYDIPWKTVHQLLINAAEKTPDVLKDKTPFVLQTNLSDFYVSYELNAYTSKPKKMALIYSELHQNIQNEFNTAGIEILSPHYELNKA